MYIIFLGEVEIVIGGNVLKVFSVPSLLGRTSIETEAKRNADLRARGDTHLLILSRQDYQTCLFNAMSHERENILTFV
jgi:hypothetical protein